MKIITFFKFLRVCHMINWEVRYCLKHNKYKKYNQIKNCLLILNEIYYDLKKKERK